MDIPGIRRCQSCQILHRGLGSLPGSGNMEPQEFARDYLGDGTGYSGSAQHLIALRRGLSNIREKLRLASTRRTTLVEDAAYSLLGIFSISGVPTIYGEGEDALGRLLAHILSGSGDTSILAWIGESSSYNSCLPAHITVFKRPATSHLPLPIEDNSLERIVTSLRTPLLDLDLAVRLYNRLNDLPAPWFAASRMKLPCLAFKLPPISPFRGRSNLVYRVETPTFGLVVVETKADLSRLKPLYLVHPWLDSLLDREDIQNGEFEDDDAASSSNSTDDEDSSDEEIDDTAPPPQVSKQKPASSHPAIVDTGPIDRETRALRLIARLRQPFGALLLTPVSTRRGKVVYKRVAADSIVTVCIGEDVPLTDLLDNVRTLDVL